MYSLATTVQIATMATLEYNVGNVHNNYMLVGGGGSIHTTAIKRETHLTNRLRHCHSVQDLSCNSRGM